MASPVTAAGPVASAFLPWSPVAFVWPPRSTSWAAALAPLRQSLTPPLPGAAATAATTAVTGPPLSDGRWILVAWALYVPALGVAARWWGRRPRRRPPPPPPPPSAPPSPAASAAAAVSAAADADCPPPPAVTVADVVAAAHNFALAAASAVLLGGVVTAAARLVASGRGGALWCAPLGGGGDGGHDAALAAVRYWLYLFYVSKYWELGDTFVLLARRKPLTLLHVWHHMSVMVETWAWLQFDMTLGAVGMAVNAGVHVLMYSYFGAAILGYRLPFRRLITRTQIVQFVASFALAAPMVATHLLRSGTKGGGGGCAGMPALGVSAFCNASYLALFLRFYRKAYRGGGSVGGGGGGRVRGIKAE